jgi:hypothetical protein
VMRVDEAKCSSSTRKSDFKGNQSATVTFCDPLCRDLEQPRVIPLPWQRFRSSVSVAVRGSFSNLNVFLTLSSVVKHACRLLPQEAAPR